MTRKIGTIPQLLFVLKQYKRFKRYILLSNLGMVILIWIFLTLANASLNDCVQGIVICLHKCPDLVHLEDENVNSTSSISEGDEHMDCINLCSTEDQICKIDSQSKFNIVIIFLSYICVIFMFITIFEWLLVDYYFKWSKRNSSCTKGTHNSKVSSDISKKSIASPRSSQIYSGSEKSPCSNRRCSTVNFNEDKNEDNA
ncbi:MAG: hypothetical protein JKX76_02520 [Colwellia sp.]|nr:hypothetical protein [Colwellia sp.]